MKRLKICGRHELCDFEGAGFPAMISIGDSDDDFDGLRLPGIEERDHLILKFSDVLDQDHPDAVAEESLAPLFAWLADTPGRNDMLVHCAAGISRSPAVALLSLAVLQPDFPASGHLETVLKAAESHHVMPNALVLQVGERILGRGDALSIAVKDWLDEQIDPFNE